MDKSTILTGFNDHLMEMLEDLKTALPSNTVIATAYPGLYAIRKANPKMIIQVWKPYVVDKYEEEIMKGNINFFLEKDYKEDVVDAANSNTILEKIDSIKGPIKDLSEENLQKTISYIQNLVKLCKVYYT